MTWTNVLLDYIDANSNALMVQEHITALVIKITFWIEMDTLALILTIVVKRLVDVITTARYLTLVSNVVVPKALNFRPTNKPAVTLTNAAIINIRVSKSV